MRKTTSALLLALALSAIIILGQSQTYQSTVPATTMNGSPAATTTASEMPLYKANSISQITDDLGGRWDMWVGPEWHFNLDLQQSGNIITGTMNCLSRYELETYVSGQVSSNGTVEFIRRGPPGYDWTQNYVGNLTTTSDHLSMNGKMNGAYQMNGPEQWYATIEKSTTIAPTTKGTSQPMTNSTSMILRSGDAADPWRPCWVHGIWGNPIGDPEAKWTWATYQVSDPVRGETQTYSREFNIDGTLDTGTLTITADNSYTATLNGQVVGTGHDLRYAQAYNVSGTLRKGTNSLVINVANDPLPGSNVETNPAGLIYSLVVCLSENPYNGSVEFVEPSQRLGEPKSPPEVAPARKMYTPAVLPVDQIDDSLYYYNGLREPKAAFVDFEKAINVKLPHEGSFPLPDGGTKIKAKLDYYYDQETNSYRVQFTEIVFNGVWPAKPPNVFSIYPDYWGDLLPSNGYATYSMELWKDNPNAWFGDDIKVDSKSVNVDVHWLRTPRPDHWFPDLASAPALTNFDPGWTIDDPGNYYVKVSLVHSTIVPGTTAFDSGWVSQPEFDEPDFVEFAKNPLGSD